MRGDTPTCLVATFRAQIECCRVEELCVSTNRVGMTATQTSTTSSPGSPKKPKTVTSAATYMHVDNNTKKNAWVGQNLRNTQG